MSKRKNGLSKGPLNCLGGGPVVLRRRTSGRGRAAASIIRVTKVRSDCTFVTGSVSAVKDDDTAQSSQDEQYFSGVCVSSSPDSTLFGV